MRDDLRTLSPEPTADAHTDADAVLDQMSLAEYLDTRGAGPVIRQAIEAAYLAEFGLELDQQSALNLLLFIHADRRSRFMPFGVFSDERYHVVEGNDRIAMAWPPICRARCAWRIGWPVSHGAATDESSSRSTAVTARPSRHSIT